VSEQVSERESEREAGSVGGEAAGSAGGSAPPPSSAVGRGVRDRILDWTEAVLWLALIGIGSLVTLAMLRIDSPLDRSGWPPAKAPDELIEAEDLEVLGKSREFTFWLQPTSGFPGGGWSKGGHMFAFGTVNGDWLELELPELESGFYWVELFLTKSRDYGIVTVSLNDEPVGEFDLWSGRGVEPTGSLDLGEVELAGDGDVLRLTVGGPNPRAAAPFFQFGVDGIRLEQVEPIDP
jgi:hypothetical protein